MMEETLWKMSQQSRELQDLRREVGVIWDDEASRELNKRYLDPHADDDQAMRESLAQQDAALDQADGSLRSSREHALRAERLALEVSEWLREVEQHLNSAYDYYDLFMRYKTAASERFPVIERLLSDANGSCK